MTEEQMRKALEPLGVWDIFHKNLRRRYLMSNTEELSEESWMRSFYARKSDPVDALLSAFIFPLNPGPGEGWEEGWFSVEQVLSDQLKNEQL